METLSLNNYIFNSKQRATTFWYAIYTRPHHEKEVVRRLQEQNITSYLPLFTTLKQWSDRKKKVSLPLFSCYVFVNIAMRDYYRVLNVSGVVRFISFDNKAVVIPEKQIRIIMDFLGQDIEVEEVRDIFYCGAKVEIISGPLTGIYGELIDFSGKKRVIIRFDEIGRSMIISVPIHSLKFAS